MNLFKKYLIIGLSCFAAGFLLGLALPHFGEKKAKPMASVDSEILKHEVLNTAPVQALDKAELKKRSIISSETAKAPDKEVLATATIKDDSGTRHVAAELDTKTGDTVLTAERPLAEWMSKDELGLGYGLANGDLAPAAFYEHTFVRAGPLYGAVRTEIFKRPSQTDWNAMAWISYRW